MDSKKIDDLEVHDVIVNRHDFNYITNPEYRICGEDSGSNVYLLIYIHTSPENLKRRLSIRETWAKRSMFRDIRLVFMMGKTSNQKTANLLNLEYNLYGDIVQEDFEDSYRNLTYKGIMAMKWITQYCKHAKFILKADDDMIVNIFILLKHIYSLDKHTKPKNTIMCLVYPKMPVIRDKNSKWYLSKEEFKDDYFGKYCSGSAFVLTGDLPPRLFNISFYIKFFWIDDYYVTGLLVRGVNASYYSFNSLYIVDPELVEERFYGLKRDYTLMGHFGKADDSISKMYLIWDFVLISQLIHYPYLLKSIAKINFISDFVYSHFSWN